MTIKKLLSKPDISFCSLIVLLSGVLFGAGVFYTLIHTTHIRLPYSDSGLGIISVTNIAHYPKYQDSLVYLLGICTAVLCGIFCLFLWLTITKLFQKKNIECQEISLKISAPIFLSLGLCLHNSLINPQVFAIVYPVIVFIFSILFVLIVIKNWEYYSSMLFQLPSKTVFCIILSFIVESFCVSYYLTLVSRILLFRIFSMSFVFGLPVFLLSSLLLNLSWVTIHRRLTVIENITPLQSWIVICISYWPLSLLLLQHIFATHNLMPLFLPLITIFLTVFNLYRINKIKKKSNIYSLNKLWSLLDYVFIPLILMIFFYGPLLPYWPISPWYMLVEDGQYLGWVQSILKGGFQGKDFFGIYGPLSTLVIAIFMKVFGVSYLSYLYVRMFLSGIGTIFIYWALRQLITNFPLAIFAFIMIAVTSASGIRIALGILAVALIVLFTKTHKNLTIFLSGIVSAVSLFYSQEFGLCAIITGFALICFTKITIFPSLKIFRILICYIGGILVGSAPLLIYFGLNNALLPLLRDLFLYPFYISKGQFALILPSIKSHLPNAFSFLYYIKMFFSFSEDNHFIWYQPAFIYSLSILYIFVKLLSGKFTKEDMSTLAITVFGILSFKGALQRSDTSHLKYVFAPAIILYTIYIGKCIQLLFTTIETDFFEKSFLTMKKILGGLMLVAFLTAGNGVTIINFIDNYIEHISTYAIKPFLKISGPSQIEKLYVPMDVDGGPLIETVKFIISNTPNDKPILAIPNSGGFYFLCDRLNATRFVLFSHIGTNKHRKEILNDIKNKKPSAIIYDPVALPIDGISNSKLFGEILQFIKSNYKIVKVIPPFYILFPK